ncbi:MAG: caspase family protein, partial [Methylocapsa sp.]|nr:caspase family protein [Methylocapsa sp.]
MKILSTLLASCLLLFACALALPAKAQGEKRIALVVGNGAYPASPLATAANDAGLVAQTLQAAGFDVTGAGDLDGDSLRSAFHDFVEKAQASGPDTVAFIYLSGYGLQLDGENFFVPVDAKIASPSDVAANALRISDYTRQLAGLPLKASFIVLDLARESPFGFSGQPLAGGLALAEADPNMLVAFNAAPGTAAPAENGPYGAYARALAEMIREGGLSPSQVFDAVRLRVNEETKGAEVPWSVSRISAAFAFFERAADAPPPPYNVSEAGAIQGRSMRELGVQDAYAAAIQRDSMEGYEDFVAAYPSDPLARRVRALLAARREARVWRRTCVVNTPDAYWSYLNRYPRGPHFAEARWRLEALSAPPEPPPAFAPIAYDVPPPPPAEIVYVERPVLVLSDPAFGFVLPPPIVFLAPVPAYLVFPPPPPPIAAFVLPIPVFTPFPAFINPPPFVVPPPNNVFFANIHNTTVINNINNTIINRGAAGIAGTTAAGVAAGAAAAAIAAR